MGADNIISSIFATIVKKKQNFNRWGKDAEDTLILFFPMVKRIKIMPRKQKKKNYSKKAKEKKLFQ